MNKETQLEMVSYHEETLRRVATPRLSQQVAVYIQRVSNLCESCPNLGRGTDLTVNELHVLSEAFASGHALTQEMLSNLVNACKALEQKTSTLQGLIDATKAEKQRQETLEELVNAAE